MPGLFSLPPWVSDPDMHHGTCKTHGPWCMLGALTSSFFWSQWWGKHSRHSRRMRNPQFYVSGKRSMAANGHAPHDARFTSTMILEMWNENTLPYFRVNLNHLWNFSVKGLGNMKIYFQVYSNIFNISTAKIPRISRVLLNYINIPNLIEIALYKLLVWNKYAAQTS